ncbi:MAG: dephospho-CoA kinase, partial [Alphaproteobacteria bacterium]|nr:dephospho-CoA kinase [Candidatus Fonsibacter sp. PEL55]
ENKMFDFVDIFIFVKTKSNIFKIRIKKRINLDKRFLKLLENQQADEKIKKGYADFTVDNSTKDKVKLQVKKILDKILLND